MTKTRPLKAQATLFIVLATLFVMILAMLDTALPTGLSFCVNVSADETVCN